MTGLNPITPITPGDIPPVDVGDLDQLPAVTHTPVSIDEQITEEALNRGAVTVSSSTTERLAALVGRINTAQGVLSTSVNAQTGEVVSHINLIIDQVSGNLSLLSAGIEHALARIDGIEQGDIIDIEHRLVDLEEKTNSLILVTEELTAQLAAEPHTITETAVVTTETGLQTYILASLGAGPFVGDDEYQVTVQVVGNADVRASVTEKTAESFTVSLLSDGIHYTPQPHNAELVPVVVNLVITYDKVQP